jgi:hypothetical protein
LAWTAPPDFTDGMQVDETHLDILSQDLNDLDARVTAGLQLVAKYARQTATPAVVSGADHLATFPTALLTDSQVSPNGTFDTFTLATGVWWIETGWRGVTGTSGAEVRICQNSSITAANTLVNGFGTLGAHASTLAVLTNPNGIRVSWWQSSGSSRNIDTGFGQATHISFFRIGS